jgi:tripartite-type tricarboxylate transporter receptor subunit TctC
MNLAIRPAWSRAFQCAAAAVLLITTPLAAWAQDNFPSKPIRIIVPFGPGGSPDVLSRMIGKELQIRTGQPVIVENRPGANSIIGTAAVANAPPDGYTILYGTNSGISSARSLVKNLPYDPVKSLSGVIILQEGYFVLVGKPGELPNFPQFIDRIKKDPNSTQIGGASVTILVTNKLMANAGKLEHTYVPYKENSRLLLDVMGGQIAAGFSPVGAALPFIAQGKLAPLAVTGPERLSSLPNVPTIAETLPGVSLALWTGYFVPAKTPRPIVDYLYKQLAEILRLPEMVKWNSDAGRALYMPPREVDEFVVKDEVRWQAVFRSAGIQPE